MCTILIATCVKTHSKIGQASYLLLQEGGESLLIILGKYISQNLRQLWTIDTSQGFYGGATKGGWGVYQGPSSLWKFQHIGFLAVRESSWTT